MRRRQRDGQAEVVSTQRARRREPERRWTRKADVGGRGGARRPRGTPDATYLRKPAVVLREPRSRGAFIDDSRTALIAVCRPAADRSRDRETLERLGGADLEGRGVGDGSRTAKPHHSSQQRSDQRRRQAAAGCHASLSHRSSGGRKPYRPSPSTARQLVRRALTAETPCRVGSIAGRAGRRGRCYSKSGLLPKKRALGGVSCRGKPVADRARALLLRRRAFAAGLRRRRPAQHAGRNPSPDSVPVRPARVPVAADRPAAACPACADAGRFLLSPGRPPAPLPQLAAGSVRQLAGARRVSGRGARVRRHRRPRRGTRGLQSVRLLRRGLRRAIS